MSIVFVLCLVTTGSNRRCYLKPWKAHEDLSSSLHWISSMWKDHLAVSGGHGNITQKRRSEILLHIQTKSVLHTLTASQSMIDSWHWHFFFSLISFILLSLLYFILFLINLRQTRFLFVAASVVKSQCISRLQSVSCRLSALIKRGRKLYL